MHGGFSHNPGEAHVNAAKRLFRYIRGTTSLGLTYGFDGSKDADDDIGLAVWTDASFNDNEDSRSTGSYLVMVNGGPISWMSRKQSIVALSTAEAEYMAACEAAKEAMWVKELLQELGDWGYGAVRVNVDNTSAVSIAENDAVKSRSKHIRLRYHYFRERVQDGDIDLRHVDTKSQLADALTKALNHVGLAQFISSTNIDKRVCAS
jgi:hypothetical protein